MKIDCRVLCLGIVFQLMFIGESLIYSATHYVGLKLMMTIVLFCLNTTDVYICPFRFIPDTDSYLVPFVSDDLFLCIISTLTLHYDLYSLSG